MYLETNIYPIPSFISPKAYKTDKWIIFMIAFLDKRVEDYFV